MREEGPRDTRGTRQKRSEEKRTQAERLEGHTHSRDLGGRDVLACEAGMGGGPARHPPLWTVSPCAVAGAPSPPRPRGGRPRGGTGRVLAQDECRPWPVQGRVPASPGRARLLRLAGGGGRVAVGAEDGVGARGRAPGLKRTKDSLWPGMRLRPAGSERGLEGWPVAGCDADWDPFPDHDHAGTERGGRGRRRCGGGAVGGRAHKKCAWEGGRKSLQHPVFPGGLPSKY